MSRFTISKGEHAELRAFLGPWRRKDSEGRVAIVEARLTRTRGGGAINDLEQVLPALASLLNEGGAHGRLPTLLRRARIFAIEQRAHENGFGKMPAAAAPAEPKPSTDEAPRAEQQRLAETLPPAEKKPKAIRLTAAFVAAHAPTLRAIDASLCADPKALVQELVKLRPAIIRELRAARGVGAASLPSVSVALLVCALRELGMLDPKRQLFDRDAKAQAMAVRSPTLHALPRGAIQDDESMVRFLLAYRDRIALESRADGEGPHSLSTLFEALCVDGKVASSLRSGTGAAAAIAMEHYLARRDLLEPEVERLGDSRPVLSRVDRSLFTRLQKPGEGLRRGSSVQSIVQWGRWLKVSDAPTRSILGAPEIASALLTDCAPGLPAWVARRIADAAHRAAADPAGARRDAVVALKKYLDTNDRRRGYAMVQDAGREDLERLVWRLVAWNSDVLPAEEQFAHYGAHAFVQGFASSRRLGASSPLLRTIGAKAIADPVRLARTLAALRPRIIAEQCALRGVDERALERLPLTKLFEAAAWAHHLRHDLSRYERPVGMMELVRCAPALRDIEKEDLATPAALIAKLLAIQPLLQEPARAIAGAQPASMVYLVEALATAGIIEGKSEPYEEYARAYELFHRSPLLQGIEGADLSTPARLAVKLEAVREAVVSEQRALLGASRKQLKTIPPRQLALALVAGGRLTSDVEPFLRAAASTLYTVYVRSPKFQELESAPEILADAGALARFLLTFRDRIAVDNLRAEGKLPAGAFTVPKAEDFFSLPTLGSALEAVGLLDDRATSFTSNAAPLLDYYFKCRLLIDKEIDKVGDGEIKLRLLDASAFRRVDDPSRLVSNEYMRSIVRWGRWLRRQGIPLRSLYGADEIDAMLHARSPGLLRVTPPGIVSRLREAAVLAAAHPAKARTMAVEGLAAIVEYFDRLEAAGEALSDDVGRGLAQVRQLVEWNRDALEERRDPGGKGGAAPAPDAGKRLAGDAELPPRASTSTLAKIYHQSPTLQGITPEILADARSLMRFLLAFRDRVAVENLRAEGKLPPGAFTFPKAEEHFALTTLVNTLEAMGFLDESADRLKSTAACPLDYYFKRRHVLDGEIANVGEGDIRLHAIDLSLFTRLDDPSRRVSETYIRNIVKWARWLRREEVPLRSLYGADEMAAIMSAKHEAFLRAAPKASIARLTAAAGRAAEAPAAARAEAVETLASLAEHVEAQRNAQGELPAAFEAGLAQARCFVEGNRDAPEGAGGGGGTAAGEKGLALSGQTALGGGTPISESFAPASIFPAFMPAILRAR